MTLQKIRVFETRLTVVIKIYHLAYIETLSQRRTLMSLIQELHTIEAEDMKKAFIDFLEQYLNPAFGSMSKRDIDILLFMKLQELGLIQHNPELYEIVSSLKVTRAKARNLLYEAKMRTTTEDELDNELKTILKSPIFLKENDKISLEIGNPLLIDHLRDKLKKLKHITDGSFSPELVKLTIGAYAALFESMLNEKSKDTIRKALIQCGAIEEPTLKGILTNVFKSLSGKFLGKMGDEIVSETFEYFSAIMDENIPLMKELFTELLQSENSKQSK